MDDCLSSGTECTAGDSFEELDRRERRDRALGHGFAVAQTNTGHDRLREPLFSFARDSQKLIDYAYRAVHITALVAKTIARAYYRKSPVRSYFAGCSTGGRQGLISAQRFPDDFDGILVGAPVLDVPAIEAQIIGARRALASSLLSAEKVEYLAAFVQHKCDAIDGVADGVVDDPRRCTIDFATEIPACGAVGDDSRCLTVAERHVLDVFARDVTSNGVPVYPAFPTGTGILAPDVSAPGGVIRTGWVSAIRRSSRARNGSSRITCKTSCRARDATGGRLISIATCTNCSRLVRCSMRRIRTSVFSARAAASS
jgi:hypothetical protein